MKFDIAEVTSELTDRLRKELGDELELVFLYGSAMKGTAHEASDIDISYVPVHEDTWKCITIQLCGTLIDFYPIHWSRLNEMAEYEDVSGTVLLEHKVLYSASKDVEARMKILAERYLALQRPEARLEMLGKALAVFQRIGYPCYLLRMDAARGAALACLRSVQSIVETLFLCLKALNQSGVDTRKLDQVLSLPKLPPGFKDALARVSEAPTIEGILSACDDLVNGVRQLLVSEQKATAQGTAAIRDVFSDEAYPEMGNAFRHVLRSCARKERLSVNGGILVTYTDIAVRFTKALSGVGLSGFNSLSDHELELSRYGFPDLEPAMLSCDYDAIGRMCTAFDKRLREFLTEHSVGLNSLESVEDLRRYLSGRKG